MPDTILSSTEAAWDAFVSSHSHGHILQTSRWAKLKCGFGWSADRAVLKIASGTSLRAQLAKQSPTAATEIASASLEADTAILAGASLLFRRLPWGQTLAYAPKGPLANWEDAAQVRALLTAMRTVCRRHRAALLVIEPELLASPELATRLTGYGFHPCPQRIQPLSTIHVDLASDEEMILARMKQKWRYNIRLAERKGVTVREGNAADLPAIQKLMEVTAARDAFGVHNLAYHILATELFLPAGLMTWLIAEHEGEMLAAIAVFALDKTAWYMWGASSDEGRHLMPNHALQWAGIRWARARGCQVYDLWGIPDEVEGKDAYANTEARSEGGLWGVYRFKQGFGGQVVRYIGAWDMPVSGVGYALYRMACRARNVLTAPLLKSRRVHADQHRSH